MKINRHFVKDNIHPYDTINWVITNARIAGADNQIYFSQDGVEFPDFFSATAVNVVTHKYFRRRSGNSDGETSLKQLIDRVVNAITEFGKHEGYFGGDESAENFRYELTHILVRQMACFNSPVWFNIGVTKPNLQGYYWDPDQNLTIRTTLHPPAAACYLLKVEDSMESILEWYKTEGLIFKSGAGSGVNLSPLRSKKDWLSGGGKPSGPVSFMKAADVLAGTIKSGGKTRRAAKLVCLNADHPDILEFVHCKAKEEDKARALIAYGYSPDFNVEDNAYENVFFQNANHSVRVTHEFMDRESNNPTILREIAKAAWKCGDPGLQFHDTINRWNTCRDTEEITTTNPCGETHLPDNLACNLASINLLKFLNNQGEFDIEGFAHTVEVMIVAQDILVSLGGYPTPEIAKRSYLFRPVGLGYANLGALLMTLGVPYDSDRGRTVAAAITSLMTAKAYKTSLMLAATRGAFPKFGPNKDSFADVIEMHVKHHKNIDSSLFPQMTKAIEYAGREWELVKDTICNKKLGPRNMTVTAIAPTGTISFMMDCDTTGIEPELALVKHKKLVGGGVIKTVNKAIRPALRTLGYSEEQISDVVGYVEETGDLDENAPHINRNHLSVFATSLGKNSIVWKGHVEMIAAVQPFISMGISKTVNMPRTASVDDILNCFIFAWTRGLKCITVYRDGCKESQPLNLNLTRSLKTERSRLPDTRKSITHRFEISGHDGYITVGMYDNGSPGEMFITVAREGSTLAGLANAFAVITSLALQWGVPIKAIADKLKGMSFEPMGLTTNPKIKFVRSIMDYIGKWLDLEFVATGKKEGRGEKYDLSLPLCQRCGHPMMPGGACHQCSNCGETTGCS